MIQRVNGSWVFLLKLLKMIQHYHLKSI
jgi:hypothetical protein